MSRRDRVLFGLSLLAVVVVPGLATAAFSRFGYETLATLSWLLGYGGGAVVLWYVWVRPIDITGPDGIAHLDGEDSAWEDGPESGAESGRPGDDAPGEEAAAEEGDGASDRRR